MVQVRTRELPGASRQPANPRRTPSEMSAPAAASMLCRWYGADRIYASTPPTDFPSTVKSVEAPMSPELLMRSVW